MKEFRKTEDGLFICEECGKTFKTRKNGLCRNHIYKFHDPQEYYDKWLKTKDEDYCVICNNKTIFISVSHGYKKCCNKKCSNIYRYNKTKEGCFKKYGKDNVWKVEKIKQKRNKTMKKRYGAAQSSNCASIKEKRKQTMIKKYNVEYYVMCEDFKNKSKETCLTRYGVEKTAETDIVRQKSKQTLINKTGYDCTFKSPDVKKKIKKTMLTKYGVEKPMQNEEIFFKQQQSAKKINYFKNTDLIYQGSYELDLLEKYYTRFPNIKRGPRIKYLINNESHYYYSDFIIPSLNLIIEVKSSWTYNEKDEIKKNAAIMRGYNYIMIMDKNYKEFNELISS